MIFCPGLGSHRWKGIFDGTPGLNCHQPICSSGLKPLLECHKPKTSSITISIALFHLSGA